MESAMPICHRSNKLFPPRIGSIIICLVVLASLTVSCSEDPVIIIPDPVIQKETRIIADINYVDNTYFFLDNPNGPFIRPHVGEIEVWVSVNEIERQNTEIITFFGLAFVDTTARGNPIRDAKAAFEAGQDTPPREEGYFKLLEFGMDYRYVLDIEDESVFGIELIRRVEDNKILAVRYINEYGDSIGDYAQFPMIGFPGEEEDFPIFLEVIKPRNPRPTNQFGYTWDFMMRFIYNLGLTDIDASTLEIEIEDLSNNIINTQPEGESVPYIRIFGLDRFDEYGNQEPDNRVDLQAGLIDFNRGLLTFSSLRPFDPNIADVAQWTAGDDSFIVPDDYVNLNLANSTIYDDYLTGIELQMARRYNIVVTAIGKCPCGGTIMSRWNSSREGSIEIPTTSPWLEALR
jgi:hypothetical protein